MATQKQLAALKKARAAKAKKANDDLIPVHWTMAAKNRKKAGTKAKKKTVPKRKAASKLSGVAKYVIMYKEKGTQWSIKNYVTKAEVKMYLDQFLADFDYHKNFSTMKITKPNS